MRIVLFSRVPRWYSFKNERLASSLTAAGFEVVGIVVEETPTFQSLKEWTKKLGWRVFARKLGRRLMGKRNFSNDGVKSVQATKPNIEISPKAFHFKSHNSPECVEQVRELKPDIIVLRGCGIIKKAMLEENVMNSFERRVLNNEQIKSTAFEQEFLKV